MKQNSIKSGEQTKITEKINKLASALPNFQNGAEVDFIFAVLKIIHQKLKPDYSAESKEKFLRNRTAEEILEGGFATGCTDYALLAAAVFRAKNIPTIYIETFRRRWLESDDEFIEGHIFLEIFLKDRWLIIDPENAAIKGWYDRFVVYKKGLDSWDISIKNMEDLKQIAFDFRNNYRK